MTRPSGHADAIDRIDAALPQTQCTRCGEPDCRSYARAIAEGAPINRCPPGGEAGIRRLATLTGRAYEPLDPDCGAEDPRTRAWIDEAACIGCTLCIQACPVDCIVGAPKQMHTVIDALCTGCELCVPACPVDCIHLDIATPGRSGWAAWSNADAERSRSLYQQRSERHQRADADAAARLAARTASVAPSSSGAPAPSRQDAIAAALARARARRGN